MEWLDSVRGRLSSGFWQTGGSTGMTMSPRCSLVACRWRVSDGDVATTTMATAAALWLGEREKEEGGREKEIRAIFIEGRGMERDGCHIPSSIIV